MKIDWEGAGVGRRWDFKEKKLSWETARLK
jgi:hypothetical protein